MPTTPGSRFGDFPNPAVVWCVSFVYAALLALVLQKLMLPLLPSLHAGHGLLANDATLFHELAVEMAQRIHENGWSEWRLHPHVGVGGNVGLLAALYTVLGPDPAWLIPFSAAAHATAALMLYFLGPMLWPGDTGRLGGLIAATLFLVFPSALMWYGQIHKDAFSIAGILMMLTSWLGLVADTPFPRRRLTTVALAVAGYALVFFVRPHLPQLISLAFVVAWLALAATSAFRRTWRADRAALGLAALLTATLMTCHMATSSVTASYNEVLDASSNVGAEEGSWHWTRNAALPARIDLLFERISRARASFAQFGIKINAGSQIDVDRQPATATAALAYMPRATLIGLFAPFPDTWGERLSLFRVVGAVETLIWYLLAPGILLLACQRPSKPLLAGLVFAGVIITILAYTIPNVGTLYRQRYGLLFFFVLAGATGWARLVLGVLSATGGGRPHRTSGADGQTSSDTACAIEHVTRRRSRQRSDRHHHGDVHWFFRARPDAH
jgi:hypothetical protein